MRLRSKSPRIVTWIAVAVAIGVPTAMLWRHKSGSNGLADGIRAYRSSGLPWTSDEVVPKVPASEDGGPELLAALSRLHDQGDGSNPDAIPNKLAANDNKEVLAELAWYAKPLEMIEAATRKPHAVFPKDWDLGPAILFPELAYARWAEKLLSYRALARARTGDTAGSNRDLTTAWNLADRIGEEPMLFALEIQVEERIRVFVTIERCAAAYAKQPSKLAALQTTLAGMMGTPDFARAMRGQSYMILTMLRNFGTVVRDVRADEDNPNQNLLHGTGAVALPHRTGVPAGFRAELFWGPVLRYQGDIQTVARADRNDVRKLDVDLRQLSDNLSHSRFLKDPYDGILTPRFNPTSSMLASEAYKNSANALVAAMLVEAHTGRPPKSLSDVPGGPWIDPFNGSPLNYKVTGSSIQISSVGLSTFADPVTTMIAVGYPPAPRARM